MNPYGMNLNNDISTRVKNIVEPYEKKIKDLEEQLRKKDFEIAVLKEKLHDSEEKNRINQMNMPMNMGMGGMNQGMGDMNMGMGGMNMGMGGMNMGMGGMNMGMGGMNMGMGGMNMGMGDMNMGGEIFEPNNEKKDYDIISVIFRFSGETGANEPILLRCFIDDEFGFIQKKVLKKLNVSGTIKFIFNGKNANPNLTMAELGIENNANIFIENTKDSKISLKKEPLKNSESGLKCNVTFKTSQGAVHLMILDPNISIGSAITKYLLKVGRENLINISDNKLMFLFNAKRYTTKDTISLINLFKGNTQASIVVNDVNNVIGA